MSQNQQPKTMIFSISAPRDADWLRRWEMHLYPLEQAGRVSLCSVEHRDLGTDRSLCLDHWLNQADLIIPLLSASFFADDECCSLVDRALTRHQQNDVRLIPLLLSPITFPQIPLATLTPLPSNKHPVTQWQDPEAALNNCVQSLYSLLDRDGAAPSLFFGGQAYLLTCENKSLTSEGREDPLSTESLPHPHLLPSSDPHCANDNRDSSFFETANRLAEVVLQYIEDVKKPFEPTYQAPNVAKRRTVLRHLEKIAQCLNAFLDYLEKTSPLPQAVATERHIVRNEIYQLIEQVAALRRWVTGSHLCQDMIDQLEIIKQAFAKLSILKGGNHISQ